jgi:PAS domain S-box-containing protein
MKKNVRVLIAGDQSTGVDLIKTTIIKRLGANCEFSQVTTLESFSASLEEFRPEVIISDYHPRFFDGIAGFRLARKHFPGIPFIFIFNTLDEIGGAAGFEGECWDHIIRGQLDDIGCLINSILEQKGKQKEKQSPDGFFAKKEHQLATLMENLPGMAFLCKNDRARTMEFVSQGGFVVTGYPPEALEKNTATAYGDLIHPEDRDRVWLTVQNAVCRNDRYELSYRLLTGQKKERWVWEQGVGVWENGAWHLEGFIWDITEHKQAEKALREKDEKLRLIMEHTTSLVAILDASGLYEYISPSHQALLGFNPEDLLGRSGFDNIHPDDLKKTADILGKGVSGEIDRVYGLTYRVMDQKGDPHILIGNFDSIRDDKGDLKNIIFVGNDISERRALDKELDKEKEKFRTLVEELPLGILLFDRENRIEYINPKFTDLFGYARNDIATGAEWFRKAYPNIEYREQILESWKEDREQARLGGSPPRKYTIFCKDGSEKVVVFVYIILTSGQQLVVCQDVTRQDALETQFMHSQKMESIGRLASGIAHDFNNLLTSIIGNADFAMMDFEKHDPRYEIIQEIKAAADRAAGLTRQLLAFSRKQRRNPEVLDLNAKITDIKRMLQRLIGEDIVLELFLAPDLKLVEIDPGQLEQMIMNLVVNARDAMPDGGKLTVETANVESTQEDPVSPVALTPGAYVLISMTDTGGGISPEIQSRVFEPFFTTKEKGKGTGLGLSTVYGIVKQNHGNILLYSVPGKGTTLKIFLPAYDKTIPTDKSQRKKATNLYGTETILLVEDEERVRKIVETMLSRYGYTVLTAGDGREAQQIFKTHHLPVKFLLTDMVMPGINGLELAKVLLGEDPGLKVLCMSGYTDSTLLEEIRKEDIAFIHKPFTSTVLVQAVRELLDT